MIGMLHGTVMEREPSRGRVILDVGGVGYEVAVSVQTLRDVPESGAACKLWIHTHVREDTLALFGFASAEERALFRLLVSVPKVGPKNALATLGGLPWIELVRVLAAGEHGRLTKIPGIGKKTAEQMVLTLGDKVGAMLEKIGDTPATAVSTSDHPQRDEAQTMLVALGWKAKAVHNALDKVLPTTAGDTALDEIVRRTLAQLMDR